MSHFMKTSGPSGLAKPRGPGRLAADDPAHCRIVTKTFGIVHILVAGETAEHRLPQHGDRSCRSAHRRARRLPGGQSKCVVKFGIAQLITNKPVALTGYLRFPVAAGLFRSNVEHAKRLWFTRDHLAMAQPLGWDRVASFYIDLEAPARRMGGAPAIPINSCRNGDGFRE